MKRYDPLKAPDPKAWLALDEQERIDLVEAYHRRAGIGLPNANLHAAVHAVIETQIALGDEMPVERKLRSLMSAGLNRHDAIHAIGTALTDLLFDVSCGGASDADPNPDYLANVERVTAESWRQLKDQPPDTGDSATGEIDPSEILDELDAARELPKDAIRAASAHRAVMVPAFLKAIQKNLTDRSESPRSNALFFIFHLLGEWREKSAYRPLAELLRQPDDDALFEGANTSTCHRVMAAVFDGDPQPLYDIILDTTADDFIRARMCEVLAMVALRGELPRAEAARFLRAGYSDLEPKDESCFVWDGWQSAIAALGLVELKPLVEEAFNRQYIDPSYLSFSDFEHDLQRALENPDSPWENEREFALFGDTVEELSGWQYFEPHDLEDYDFEEGAEEALADGPWSPHVPAVNPHKGIGRNDPCPCGSGKKFKNCCLN